MSLLRALYSLSFALATPLVLARLWWRGRREPGYRRHIGERFGAYPQPALKGAVWIHGVSVGEIRAATPLVDSFRRDYPDRPILLTCMTPTGRAVASELFSDRATIAYLPYDFAWAHRRLIAHFRPAVLLIMETEIWFNLIAACRAADVPALLVNARLSEKSRGGYASVAPVRALVRDALRSLHAVSAQAPADAERLQSLGAANVVVNGNIKFDIAADPALVARGEAWRRTCPQPRVLLMASTRDGEEAMLLDAYRRQFDAAARRPILLVLVPRHPQRFEGVFTQIESTGLRASRRSGTATPPADCDVWLGDSMGEMAAYFAMCDVAIVGGSFENRGGQNFIEALALGKPVIVGPHTFNFAEATRLANDANALVQASDADHALQAAQRLLEHDAARMAMGSAASQFAAAHRGATQKTMGLVAPLLKR
jgi:3-deoxy-D-manno-octulosonic-acid transferase